MTIEKLKLPCLLLVCLVTALPPATATSPDTNPYGMISQKNTFRLQPLPNLILETPRPSAKLALQRFTTVLCCPQVLIKVIPAGNGSETSREISLILTEGEVAEGVEVLEIDVPACIVRVLNYGTPQKLSF